MTNYARWTINEAYLSEEWGKDYAKKVFGDDIDSIPCYKRGKRVGQLKGKLVWAKTTKGGWMHEIGVVSPNVTFAHGIWIDGKLHLGSDAYSTKQAEADLANDMVRKSNYSAMDTALDKEEEPILKQVIKAFFGYDVEFILPTCDKPLVNLLRTKYHDVDSWLKIAKEVIHPLDNKAVIDNKLVQVDKLKTKNVFRIAIKFNNQLIKMVAYNNETNEIDLNSFYHSNSDYNIMSDDEFNIFFNNNKIAITNLIAIN